ncbi:MAG: PH domain-containing protein [Acidobacteriota bacterium]
MNWRATLLRLLRVPHEPEPPPGSPPRQFRAAPNFFKLRLLQWGLTHVVVLVGLTWATWFVRFVASTPAPRPVVWLLVAAELFGWTAFLLGLVFGGLMVRLDYELRWYMLSDRAIRIREGVATVREKTIALANVQNLAIRQGPLQRILGIADVEVKTAGGGSGHEATKKHTAEPMHVAYFRGVDNAEQIRDLVRAGVRLQRNAGLGDPEEHQHHTPHPHVTPEDTRAAVEELLREARALRAAIR